MSPYRGGHASALHGGPVTVEHDRVTRDVFEDGRRLDTILLWTGQRDGRPAVGVSLPVVLTREMWTSYKTLVDEMFDAFEAQRRQLGSLRQRAHESPSSISISIASNGTARSSASPEKTPKAR